jgi:opacity protein-like surface antigen
MRIHLPMIAALLALPLAAYSPAGRALEIGETYYGAQYARMTYDKGGFDDLEPTALVLRLGKIVSPGVGVEGRLGFGLSDDSGSSGRIDYEFEIDHLLGVYVVGTVDAGDSASFYGLLGLSRVDANASASLGGQSVDDSGDESGFSFGIGAEFGPPKTRFNIEYISYLDEDDFELTAVSLGVRF